MIDFKRKDSYSFEDLLEIIRILRSEDGCQWDREQTHSSIRRNFIEETYEVVEAIDNDDMELLKEELGDVLLHVVMHSQMEAENNVFNIEDVADGICKKLIFRHPHIFLDKKQLSSDEVMDNWEKIKHKEKGYSSITYGMQKVCKALPALVYAEKIQKKAQNVGFDFDNIQDMLGKVDEEMLEVRQAIDSGDMGCVKDELGDLLFSVVNIYRKLKIDPEESLRGSTYKFLLRFSRVEEDVKLQGKEFSDFSAEELLLMWEKSKDMDGL